MRAVLAFALTLVFSSGLWKESRSAGARAGHASRHRQSYGEGGGQWRGPDLETADRVCRRQQLKDLAGFVIFRKDISPDCRTARSLSTVDDLGR